MTDPTGSTYTFTYDNDNRLTQTTTAYGSIPGKTFTVGYGYDDASNRTSMTPPQEAATSYVYNTLNQLTSIASPRGTFSFSYDNLGRRSQLTRPNNLNTDYAYDPVSRLNSALHKLSGNAIDGATYTYGPAGNRLTRTDNRTGVQSTFGYDNIYQLTSVTQGAPTTESYTYDPVGNRLTSLGGVSYSYDSSNHLNSMAGATFTYDPNGSVLTKADSNGTTTYTWDYDNRLASVQVPGAGTVTFTYDPFGRRIRKVSRTGAVAYIYDGDNVIQEVGRSGNPEVRYTYGPGIDEPLAVQAGRVISYYEADGLGSITSLSGPGGVLRGTYQYDSFGMPKSSTDRTNWYRYTARQLDPETGLYYYRARYYDPQIGRFLSEDPISFQGGVNFYAYVYNDPANWVDPLGLEYAVPLAQAGAAVGLGITAVGSLVVDAATGGLNIAATPAELAGGAALGAAIGLSIGSLIDSLVDPTAQSLLAQIPSNCKTESKAFWPTPTRMCKHV